MTSRAWIAPPLIGVVLASAGAAHATQHGAPARYVARPADGGRVVLDVDGGRLRRLATALPARCESENGRSWDATLAIELTGSVPPRSGRFAIQGQAANDVRYQLDGRLRKGAISGRVRLTYLDLDFVGPSDDSYLCDTGTMRYRGVKRR